MEAPCTAIREVESGRPPCGRTPARLQASFAGGKNAECAPAQHHISTGLRIPSALRFQPLTPRLFPQLIPSPEPLPPLTFAAPPAALHRSTSLLHQLSQVSQVRQSEYANSGQRCAQSSCNILPHRDRREW